MGASLAEGLPCQLPSCPPSSASALSSSSFSSSAAVRDAFLIADSGNSLLPSTLSFSWQQGLTLVFAVWLAYAICVTVQRLWLSPIAHIPGPRLAALTQWYEFYYDIILGGQYTFRIIEMHAQYGPVVRISPWEVHVGDPDFHGTLYGSQGRTRNKWLFYTKQFGAPYSALATIDHHHHKLRRSALNPFFSTQVVRKLQPVLDARVNALLNGLARYAAANPSQPLDVMYPFSAFSNDVINEFAFARSDRLTEQDDFGAHVTNSLLTGTRTGNLIKHANWILTLVTSIPDSISARIVPGWDGWLKMKHDLLVHIREIQSASSTSTSSLDGFLDVQHPTIFHEMLSSKALPPPEKCPERLAQEAQIIVQGGTLTTSWALSVAVFHLLHRPSALRRLRTELLTAIPAQHDQPTLATLEALPYLRAVVKEALRHAIGTSSRLARVAPSETLFVPATPAPIPIPPGTVVGMSPYRTIMDPSIFEDPLAFRPERWTGDAEDRLDPYFHIWGGGPRKCLGQPLAYAECFLVLAGLFRRWGSADDAREGDAGRLSIFETTPRDAQMAADYFIPYPYAGSKGIRIVFELN